jgi:hypothetical protein
VALLHGVEIGEQQFGVDDVNVMEGIDGAGDVDDLGVVEAADDVCDGIGGADVAEKLVAQAFALGCALDQAGDVDSIVVGTRLLGWMRSAILVSRSSGTVTTPVLGSMVQKG